jgi:hypothetical protein
LFTSLKKGQLLERKAIDLHHLAKMGSVMKPSVNLNYLREKSKYLFSKMNESANKLTTSELLAYNGFISKPTIGMMKFKYPK